uniref:von Willebrand factor D and EGF domain-containing protein-like n=1 Tax=Crassostrea virginica TaxID=6565 RepID=A0A8B8AP89_CRAVI|nr:von Willebrand factor D and EGF domain-containing protein-like [Crassostrea virginica]
MTACEVGFGNNCTKQYTIDVKNCSAFLVFKLKPVDSCNTAYCFEYGDECVNDSVSDVMVSFHNITWKKEEINGIVRYDPSINLLCSFTPSADDTLLYHIDWYVDNDIVIRGQTVDKTSLQDAILSAEDLNNKNKKINSWIHCVVGAKAARNKFPCFTEPSELFFAGIEILNETVTLERNKEETIAFRQTIPLVSPTLDIFGIQQPIEVRVDLSFPGNIENQCKGLGGIARECEKKLQIFTYNETHMYDDPSNWNTVYNIKLHSTDGSNYYLSNRRLVLRLKTNSVEGQGAQIFSNVNLHDVNVNVIENNTAWKGKCCSSYADPHQSTFDGYRYECQDIGCIADKTYIFYRNQVHLQEVQVKHRNCWGRRPRCVCAVAVRAGQDVFVIDGCNGMQYINFPLCNENSLKVIKETDKVYKVYFPTGTFVKIFLYNYASQSFYINLEVYPTVADVSRTDGLCGVVDGDKTNDLRRKDGSQDDINSYDYHNPPNMFSLSWQSTSTEDLLSMSQTVYDQLTPLSFYFYKLCLCDGEKIACSYKHFDECTSNIGGKEYNCMLHSSSRKRRDLSAASIFQQHDNEYDALLRTKRQTISEEEATNLCENDFQQSEYYNTCLQIVPNFSNETFVNCISDLTVTGEQSLTQLHLDTALGQCQTYILLNSTLQAEHPDITTIIINLCPNNCSNRGVCSGGNCTCDHGFGGSDCSFDVRFPPTITQLSDNGLCDRSEEACEDVTLYGSYFVEKMGTTCNVDRKEINHKNSVISTTSYTTILEERTLFEGYCGLQHGADTPWITKFTFNLSNDDNYYSENFTVYVYNSQCQTIHNDSGNVYFTLQSGYCFISGSCIQSATVKINDSCWQCKSETNVYEWTWDCNMTEISTSSPMTSDSSTVLSTNRVGLSSATTKSTLKISKSDRNMAPNNQEEELAIGIIVLIIAVTIISIIILATAVVMVKKSTKGKQNSRSSISPSFLDLKVIERNMSSKPFFDSEKLPSAQQYAQTNASQASF